MFGICRDFIKQGLWKGFAATPAGSALVFGRSGHGAIIQLAAKRATRCINRIMFHYLCINTQLYRNNLFWDYKAIKPAFIDRDNFIIPARQFFPIPADPTLAEYTARHTAHSADQTTSHHPE